MPAKRIAGWCLGSQGFFVQGLCCHRNRPLTLDAQHPPYEHWMYYNSGDNETSRFGSREVLACHPKKCHDTGITQLALASSTCAQCMLKAPKAKSCNSQPFCFSMLHCVASLLAPWQGKSLSFSDVDWRIPPQGLLTFDFVALYRSGVTRTQKSTERCSDDSRAIFRMDHVLLVLPEILASNFLSEFPKIRGPNMDPKAFGL